MAAFNFNIINDYICNNRIMAILLIACIFALFLIIGRISKSDEIRKTIAPNLHVFIYVLCAYALLVFPLTAFLLGKFQSVFYPPTYLGILIPTVPVLAYLITAFSPLLNGLKRSVAIISVMMLMILMLLCGNMGIAPVNNVDHAGYRENEPSFEECMPILEKIVEIDSDKAYDYLILATPSVTKYIHWYSGEIRTLYGRDMWDNSLYSMHYDQYSEEVNALYQWICYEDAYGCFYYRDSTSILDDFDYSSLDYDALDGSEEYLGGTKFVLLAKELGVDAICFSVNEKTDRKAIDYITEKLSLSGEFLGVGSSLTDGYYILYLN